jgi:hypothetical protein
MTTSSEGLDLTNLDAMSPEETNAHLTHVWSWRGPLYELYANSLMFDYGGPAFPKLHRMGSDLFGRPSRTNIILLSAQNIHSYMMFGWETGILNEFVTLRRNGMSKEQVMELVMFSQLYSGMRGLGHVYRAVGDVLPAFAPPEEAILSFPAGWEPDPEAFRAGLDFSTGEMTPAEQQKLGEWYERTLGYLPDSIRFGLKYHPDFVKANRGKWEVAIRTLPKQFAPYLMLRHHVITGSADGLREAALLAKAWGVTRELVIQSIMATAMYFTSFEGLYAPHAALDQILDAW